MKKSCILYIARSPLFYMTKTGLKHGYFCMFLSVSLAFMTLFYCVRIFLYFNKKKYKYEKNKRTYDGTCTGEAKI